MRLSQIIATKGRPVPLRAALESSIADLPADGEIIVVDGDPSGSAEAVVREVDHPRAATAIRYLQSAPGLPVQRNVGIDAAHGEILVFIDDDCIVMPGLFEALAAAYLDLSVAGATGRIMNPAESRIGSDEGSRLRWSVLGGGRQGTMTSFGFRRPVLDVGRPREMQYMPGSLMSARRSLAAEVRFDERLSGYALGEDDDFSYRLSRHGRILYLPHAVIRHESLGKRVIDRRALDRMVILNRTYLYRKNFGGTLRGRVGFASLIAIIFVHRIVNREWDGVRGLLDGLREVRRATAADNPAVVHNGGLRGGAGSRS
jgi:GT2 family glycosyltransferase